MADQQTQEPPKPEPIREGSRWRHAPPSAEMVTGWFDEQPLHDGMEGHRERYVGGIVVIGATDKVKLTKRKQNGDPYVVEVEEAVYTPYVKVDTRIAYFRDYVRVLNGGRASGDYVGVIEPVEVPHITDVNSGYYNAHLKTGLGFHAVRHQGGGDRVSKYLVSTWRVAIYERQSYAERLKGGLAIPVLQGEGTKQVPVQKNYPDDSAVMKAETGAIGRALGVAGILVVGTGVASAEDIQEALSAPPQTGGAPDVAVVADLPLANRAATADATAGEAPMPAEQVGEQDENVTLRAQAIQLRKQLEQLSPQAWQNYVAWYSERGFAPLSELEGAPLKGAVRKLERDVAEAMAQAPGGGAQ